MILEYAVFTYSICNVTIVPVLLYSRRICDEKNAFPSQVFQCPQPIPGLIYERRREAGLEDIKCA